MITDNVPARHPFVVYGPRLPHQEGAQANLQRQMYESQLAAQGINTPTMQVPYLRRLAVSHIILALRPPTPQAVAVRLPLKTIEQYGQICLATEFSGMDCAAYIMHHLFPNRVQHLWASDSAQHCREFLAHNAPAVVYRDVAQRPLLPRTCPVDVYVPGPPCQGFSSAGLRKSWDDPRSRLYLHAVWIIQVARPKIAIIENTMGIATVHKGYILSRVVHVLNEAEHDVTVYCIKPTPPTMAFGNFVRVST